LAADKIIYIMSEQEEKKTQNEKKHELVSAWSVQFLRALNDKLEKAVEKDTQSSDLN